MTGIATKMAAAGYKTAGFGKVWYARVWSAVVDAYIRHPCMFYSSSCDPMQHTRGEECVLVYTSVCEYVCVCSFTCMDFSVYWVCIHVYEHCMCTSVWLCVFPCGLDLSFRVYTGCVQCACL